MAEQITPPDDLRRDVRRALETGRMDSLTMACKFFAGFTAVCGAVGAGVAALKSFSLIWFVGLGLVTVAGSVVAYVLCELTRLGRQSKLLDELLQSEKYYESLLRTARDERDVAVQSASQLQTRLDVILAVRNLVGNAKEQEEAIAPVVGDQNG